MGFTGGEMGEKFILLIGVIYNSIYKWFFGVHFCVRFFSFTEKIPLFR